MNNSILIIIAALSGQPCPTPIIDNRAGTWNNRDTETYERALNRCVFYYHDEAPCLKKFIKKDEVTYYAICGRANSKQTSRLRATELRGTRWIAVTRLKNQELAYYLPGRSIEEIPGCTGTCLNRRKDSGDR